MPHFMRLKHVSPNTRDQLLREYIRYVFTHICVIIRKKVTHEGFHILDYLETKYKFEAWLRHFNPIKYKSIND